jgi:hypothetical protein
MFIGYRHWLLDLEVIRLGPITHICMMANYTGEKSRLVGE